jgi:hypothetical protein
MLMLNFTSVYTSFINILKLPTLRPENSSILHSRHTDLKQDQVHPIRLNNEKMQILDVKHLVKGMWQVKIFWQANGEEFYDERVLTFK